MKKYTLLGHVFELEPRANDFLASYVSRIETYASTNTISSDILDDIKYNIIEKLYTADTPINESFVMNLAETIGEPEQIFEIKNEAGEVIGSKSNILDRRFGKQKPMIWGVCYWIAKSFNIPVSIVRLIFLVAVFIYGTSIWLYPLLALFVPFKDKKSTTGATGNIFFEIIRVIIWLGIIFFLGAAIVAIIVGLIIFTGFPLLSNQEIQAIVPPLYPLAGIGLVAMIILLIGSLGALLKKSRIPKIRAMIALVLVIIVPIGAGISGYNEFRKYNYNTKTIDTQTVGTLTTDDSTIIINLEGEQKGLRGNYFDNFFGRDWIEPATFQNIELLPSETNEIRVEVVDTSNILPQDKPEQILSKRSQITTSTSGNTIDITIPNNIFSQKVPFSFAERIINIYIPTDKKVIYNNNSTLRYGTPSVRNEYTDDKDYPTTRVYCNNKSSFTFYPQFNEWRCADTSFSEVNKDKESDGDESIGDRIEDHIEGVIDTTLSGTVLEDNEDQLEYLYIGLPVEQAETLARDQGRVFRIVEADSVSLPRTEDYRPGRINAEVYKGIVTDIDIE